MMKVVAAAFLTAGLRVCSLRLAFALTMGPQCSIAVQGYAASTGEKTWNNLELCQKLRLGTWSAEPVVHLLLHGLVWELVAQHVAQVVSGDPALTTVQEKNKKDSSGLKCPAR